MRLPFGVHETVRADFESRWSRVRPWLLIAFLGPPAVSLVVALVAEWSGPALFGWALLLVGVAVPVWFLSRRVYVHRPGWWPPLIGYSGVVQASGIWLITLRPLLALPTAAAVVAGVVAAVRAGDVLLNVADGAIAGTTLGVRSASRQARNATGHLLPAHANFDGEQLRWHVCTGPSTPDTHGGELPLREIEDVRVAEATGAPGGPVVVVRTAGRDVELVVGEPHAFAELLDRRVRLLDQPGWS